MATVDIGFARIDVPVPGTAPGAGATVAVSVRSELLRLVEGSGKGSADVQALPATFIEEVYLGLTTSQLVRLPDGSERVARGISEGPNTPAFEPGQEISLSWRTEHGRLHTA